MPTLYMFTADFPWMSALPSFYTLLALFASMADFVDASAAIFPLHPPPAPRSASRLIKLDLAPSAPPPPPPVPPPPPPPYYWFYSPPPPISYSYSYPGPPSSYNSTVIVGLPIIVVTLIFMCTLLWSHVQRANANAAIAAAGGRTQAGDVAALRAGGRATRLHGGQGRSTAGLDPALLGKLPIVQFSAKKIGFCAGKGSCSRKEYMNSCAVCISDFEEGEALKVLPACGHAFHGQCIDMWLLWHRTCPLCRVGVVDDNGDLILKKEDEADGAPYPPCGAHDAVDLEAGALRPSDRQPGRPALAAIFGRAQSWVDLSDIDVARTRGGSVLERSSSQPMGPSNTHPSRS